MIYQPLYELRHHQPLPFSPGVAFALHMDMRNYDDIMHTYVYDRHVDVISILTSSNLTLYDEHILFRLHLSSLFII